jgi:hypothetical protein
VRCPRGVGPWAGGSKTSIRWTNAANQGFREYNTEALIGKWCKEEKSCGQQPELLQLNEKKVHAINPAFFHYVVNNRYFTSKRERPSSGMVLAVMLLHVCEEITLFGFSGASIKGWYFPPPGGGKTMTLPKKKWLRNQRWVVDAWNFAATSGGADGQRGGGDRGGISSASRRRLSASQPIMGSVGSGGDKVNAQKPLNVLDSRPGGVGVVRLVDPRANTTRNSVAKGAVAAGGGYTMDNQSARAEESKYRQVVGAGEGLGRRRLLHAVGAERHCMHQLVLSNLAKMRP